MNKKLSTCQVRESIGADILTLCAMHEAPDELAIDLQNMVLEHFQNLEPYEQFELIPLEGKSSEEPSTGDLTKAQIDELQKAMTILAGCDYGIGG